MTPPSSAPDLPVTIGPDQRADYASLPNEALRVEALRHLAKLKRRPLLGQPLRDHPTMGDLTGCRKLYFDERSDVPPRWRIVYRVLPTESEPRSVEVISIGRRAYAEAYDVAAKRLGRT